VDALSSVQRMPVLLRLFPALEQLARSERLALLRDLNGLSLRQIRTTVSGYALRKLAQVHLLDSLDSRRQIAGRLKAQDVREDLQVLFSVLAEHGDMDGQTARRAYDAGLQVLLPGTHLPPLSLPNWTQRLDKALTHLDRLQSAEKERLIVALATAITHDQKMTAAESELLRAFCAALHCPLPPLYAANEGR
jgi:hypothetical protein